MMFLAEDSIVLHGSGMAVVMIIAIAAFIAITVISLSK